MTRRRASTSIVLRRLVQARGALVTRGALLHAIYAPDAVPRGGAHVLDQAIFRLRSLGFGGLDSSRCEGYRLRPDSGLVALAIMDVDDRRLGPGEGGRDVLG